MADGGSTFSRRNVGKNHTYADNGRKVEGVTTLIGEGVPKPGLIQWAADVTRDFVIDNWDDLAAMPLSERVKAMTRVNNRERDDAAIKGTKLHTLAEHLVQGEEVEYPEALAGHVASYVKFLDEWDLTATLVEASIINRSVWYAGSLDIAGTFGAAPELGCCLLDIKTARKRPRGEAAIQLTAYKNADVYLDDDGEEHDFADLGIERAFVVWVRGDGYDLIPVESGPQQFAAFRHAAWIARTRRDTDGFNDWVGDSLRPPKETA